MDNTGANPFRAPPPPPPSSSPALASPGARGPGVSKPPLSPLRPTLAQPQQQLQPLVQSQLQIPLPNSNSHPVQSFSDQKHHLSEIERAKELFKAEWAAPTPKHPVQDSPDVPLPPFHIGMTIDNGRIKLLDFVGQGSFAHVYLGYDYSNSCKCAVKCLMKFGADPKKMAMQKREVKAMEDLNGHPNVIKLIRTVESDEWLLIVMEFCQIDLYEAIMQKGGFPDFAVKDVFSQLCDGVMHCHSRGYYHRDLKPENILLDVGALTAKITDFGLATRDSWCYEMGCGSTRYIPPEACASADPTKGYSPIASDAWALGILLLNLLFSKNPWFEATMSDPIFSAYITNRPDILRYHFKISADFDAILGKVFNMDPSKRLSLPDFKKLVNDLPSFLEKDEVAEASALEPGAFFFDEHSQIVPAQEHAILPQIPQVRAASNSTAFTTTHQSNPFASSHLQGPLVVFGSIPDSDMQNPFGSVNNFNSTPLNITSSDYNPFSSENSIAQAMRGETPEVDIVNPFFVIQTAPANEITPTFQAFDSATTTSTRPANVPLPPIQDSTPLQTVQPQINHRPSQSNVPATLIWTAPARTAAPDLPNTLTLGREGIGRIGISRLATAKQRLGAYRTVGATSANANAGGGLLGPETAGSIGGDLRDVAAASAAALSGLAFLGTAIKGYVNPDAEAEEVLEGDDMIDSEFDEEDGGNGSSVRGKTDINRSAPDEESHYEVVKVDRRLIPDLEKGIKRAVNRGMKKFRPFIKSSSNAAAAVHTDGSTVVEGATTDRKISSGVSISNLKLGKGVAGGVSADDWSGLANTNVGFPSDQIPMPGAFVFANAGAADRRMSMPALLLNDANVQIRPSEKSDMNSELPLYQKGVDPSRNNLRPGKSGEDVRWVSLEENGRATSIDDSRSRARRKNNGDTVFSKVYHGLAGMNILGGQSKHHRRAYEQQRTDQSMPDALPLHGVEDSSILPAPQTPIALIVAKNAKSQATEQDFEDLVVNGKMLNNGAQSLPRHRHRVKNGQTSSEDLSIANAEESPLQGSTFKQDTVSPVRTGHQVNSPNRPVTTRISVSESIAAPFSNSESALENPFKPLNNAGNPFHRHTVHQTRPATYAGNGNPFITGIPDATKAPTTGSAFQAIFVASDDQLLRPQSHQPQGVDPSLYPIPTQNQHHAMQTHPSLPNMNAFNNHRQQYQHRSATPFTDVVGVQSYRAAPQPFPMPGSAEEPIDDETGAANAGGGASSVESEDDETVVAKRGEDRYVRGLVRGFGWLVGRDNHVERSGSHGV
ncbi:hypothetical protein HDU83_004012 [Entophlyctis luteolus]|nr:hypothetical protein HDU83_004012 [Entophlyctis luteolus]